MKKETIPKNLLNAYKELCLELLNDYKKVNDTYAKLCRKYYVKDIHKVNNEIADKFYEMLFPEVKKAV